MIEVLICVCLTMTVVGMIHIAVILRSHKKMERQIAAMRQHELEFIQSLKREMLAAKKRREKNV